MNEMRKLIESIEKIEEGYFKDQDIEHQEEALHWIKRNRTGEMDPSQITVLGRESFQAGRSGELSKEAAEHVFKLIRQEHEDGEPRFPKQFGGQVRWAADYAKKYDGTVVRLGVGDYIVKAKKESVDEEGDDVKGVNDKYDDETLNCKHCGDYFCTSKFGGECPEIQTDMFEEDPEIKYLKYPEGHEPQKMPERHKLDTMDWMHVPDDVIQMMKSFEHKMKSQNVWDKGVELAGGEDQLWKHMQWRAEEVMDDYRGSGEGIGSSDMNHFVRGIFSDIGEDDIWGWDKKLASNEDMERDKTNRAARFRNIGEAKDMVVKYQGREIGTVWQEEDGEWHGEHKGSGMSWATDNRKDMFSRIRDHEIETLNEGEIDEVVSEWMKRLGKL